MLESLISCRRAFRALAPIELSNKEIQIIKNAILYSPSCFNNQPWRYIFVKEKKNLEKLYTTLNTGNEWVKNSSIIIAVFSKKELDCNIKNRDYFLFDTGISVGFLILQITELGYVAHPIAGYNEEKAKAILKIPSDYTLISLIIVGKHDIKRDEFLNENQKRLELERPERKKLDEIIYEEFYS